MTVAREIGWVVVAGAPWATAAWGPGILAEAIGGDGGLAQLYAHPAYVVVPGRSEQRATLLELHRVRDITRVKPA